MAPPAAPPDRRLALGFAGLVAVTTVMIVLGALVRANDAGLACPDWPLCFGEWIPRMDVKVAFEWGHRALAGAIAFAFVGLAAWALMGREREGRRRGVFWPLAIAAPLLLVQAVLGGFTVLLQLAPWTVTAHLLLGNTFNATLLLAFLALREGRHGRARPALPTRLRRLVWAVAGLLVAQMVLGGLVSSNYAGLSCPEWPTCSGGVWFPSWQGPVGLHLLHRTNGYALVLALLAAAWTTRRHPGVARPLRLAALLALAQVGVGVANVTLGLPVEVTALHSALAAALVLCVTWAAREAWLRPVATSGPRRRVVVVGAGFGGLAVAKALRDAPVEVLVLDRENYHAFLPLLYQVATSGLSAQDVTHPVRSIVRRLPNASFRMAEVVGVHADAREVETRDGGRIPYDALVVAAGSTTEHFGNESAARHTFPLHHVDEALALRNHVLECLERAAGTADANEREALLGFVVVGGGPTGVELAGMLGEMRRHVVPRDFPRLAGEMRVVVLEGRDRLLGAFPAPLCQRALEQVRELGVEVRLGTMVDEVDPDGVRLRDGGRIRARTVVWAAGIRGASLGGTLGVELERGARVPVDEALRVEGREDVYAIGDLAVVRGADPLPQVAQVAIQQGRCVARNIEREIAGAPPLPFRYLDPGAMATIGRDRAVAWMFGVRMAGRLAWLAWLLVHIAFLAGFRNRASVFVNWIYHYFSYDLGLRSIVGPRRPPAGRDSRSRADAA